MGNNILYLITTDLQVSTFADMEGDETFDSSLLGYADEVVEERIADDEVVLIKGTKNSSAVRVLCVQLLSFIYVIVLRCHISYKCNYHQILMGVCLFRSR